MNGNKRELEKAIKVFGDPDASIEDLETAGMIVAAAYMVEIAGVAENLPRGALVFAHVGVSAMEKALRAMLGEDAEVFDSLASALSGAVAGISYKRGEDGK